MRPLPSIKELAAREAERARHLLMMDGAIKKPITYVIAGALKEPMSITHVVPELRHGEFKCQRCPRTFRTRYRTRPKIHCKRCTMAEKREVADYKVIHRRDLRAANALVAGRVPGKIGRPSKTPAHAIVVAPGERPIDVLRRMKSQGDFSSAGMAAPPSSGRLPGRQR